MKELVKQEGTSINQFITTAVAEKMSALKTKDYLDERARRGSRRKFERALRKVADVEPEERDRRPLPRYQASFTSMGTVQIKKLLSCSGSQGVMMLWSSTCRGALSAINAFPGPIAQIDVYPQFRSAL